VIRVVPVATPIAIPDDEPIVATAVLLLLHLQPGVVLFRVVVAPRQMEVAPVIAAGAGLMVTTVVTTHPPQV
jgi:hypothetical protein